MRTVNDLFSRSICRVCLDQDFVTKLQPTVPGNDLYKPRFDEVAGRQCKAFVGCASDVDDKVRGGEAPGDRSWSSRGGWSN